MKKRFILTVLFILLAAFSTINAETRVTFPGVILVGEIPFYFGYGTGKLFINGETITDYKGNDNNYVIDNPYYLVMGMEGPVTPNVHIGWEVSYFNQTARPRDITDPEYRHELLSLLIHMKYFPKETGLFTKFGFGWCQLDNVEDFYNPSETDIHDTYDGYTFLVGIGYELVGEKLHAGISLEYSMQTYEDSYDQSTGSLIDNSDIRSDLVTLSVRIGWY